MKKILVIEDSETMLKLINVLLKKEGFEVFEARNGWEGLEKANEQLPDLIVSDIIMPGLDGFNLLKQLKKYPLINKIPLIFLSGKDDVLSIDEGINLGASAFLTKPLDAEKFIKTINRMI
ncbi:MAG: response regulator [Bacteroidales bacterium]|nr:response regulator [Bacteroidales bacterium]